MITFDIADLADQQFSAILNGQRVTIRLRYNPRADRWAADVSIDSTPVLHGRRIVTGVDILRPFNFGIGLLFALPEDGVAPSRDAIPSGRVKLYHTTPAELAELNA